MNKRIKDMPEEKSVVYPYWKNDFEKEFGNTIVWYVPARYYNKEKKQAKLSIIDSADSYRVFMILCNNNFDKTRMEVLEMLRNATEENPIVINDEVFWSGSK